MTIDLLEWAVSNLAPSELQNNPLESFFIALAFVVFCELRRGSDRLVPHSYELKQKGAQHMLAANAETTLNTLPNYLMNDNQENSFRHIQDKLPD